MMNENDRMLERESFTIKKNLKKNKKHLPNPWAMVVKTINTVITYKAMRTFWWAI